MSRRTTILLATLSILAAAPVAGSAQAQESWLPWFQAAPQPTVKPAIATPRVVVRPATAAPKAAELAPKPIDLSRYLVLGL
jgi:hypothetical protein